MKAMGAGLIALAAGIFAFGTAHAQSGSRDFARDRWGHFTIIEGALAGVRGKSDADDLLLLACRDQNPRLDLSFHPAEQSGLDDTAEARLVFDGGAPIEAAVPVVAVLNNLLFILPERDSNFRAVMEKLASSQTLEIVIVQPGAAQRRHSFTLAGAAEAIAPTLKLCGR